MLCIQVPKLNESIFGTRYQYRLLCHEFKLSYWTLVSCKSTQTNLCNCIPDNYIRVLQMTNFEQNVTKIWVKTLPLSQMPICVQNYHTAKL